MEIIFESYNIFKIDNETRHLNDICEDELLYFIDSLASDVIRIKQQVESIVDFKSVDRKWLASAKASMRIKAMQKVTFVQRLSEIKKENRSIRALKNIESNSRSDFLDGKHQEFPSIFLRVAKERLESSIYLDIAREAGRLCDLEESQRNQLIQKGH